MSCDHCFCLSRNESFAIVHFQAATKKQKYEKISEKKMSTPVEVLCKVRMCPLETGWTLPQLCHWRGCVLHTGLPCRVRHVFELLSRLAFWRGSRLHVPASTVSNPLQVNPNNAQTAAGGSSQSMNAWLLSQECPDFESLSTQMQVFFETKLFFWHLWPKKSDILKMESCSHLWSQCSPFLTVPTWISYCSFVLFILFKIRPFRAPCCQDIFTCTRIGEQMSEV